MAYTHDGHPAIEAKELLPELTGPSTAELAEQFAAAYRRRLGQLDMTDEQWLALAEGLGVQIGQVMDWLSLARTGQHAPREVRRTTNRVAKGRLDESARVAANKSVGNIRNRR